MRKSLPSSSPSAGSIISYYTNYFLPSHLLLPSNNTLFPSFQNSILAWDTTRIQYAIHSPPTYIRIRIRIRIYIYIPNSKTSLLITTLRPTLCLPTYLPNKQTQQLAPQYDEAHAQQTRMIVSYHTHDILVPSNHGIVQFHIVMKRGETPP